MLEPDLGKQEAGNTYPSYRMSSSIVAPLESVTIDTSELLYESSTQVCPTFGLASLTTERQRTTSFEGMNE